MSTPAPNSPSLTPTAPIVETLSTKENPPELQPSPIKETSKNDELQKRLDALTKALEEEKGKTKAAQVQAAAVKPTPPVTPPVPAKSVAPTFTWNQATIDAKLEAVRANLSQYDGKPGYNPHMYLHKVVKPLVERMEGGETSESLYNAILSLDERHNAEAPGNTAKENRELGCVEPQSSGKSHALGQHMGASYLSKS